MVYAARSRGTSIRSEEALDEHPMGPTGVLERRSRIARLLEPRAGERRRRLLLNARHALVVVLVAGASIVGAYGVLDTYDETRQLSVGQIELSGPNPADQLLQ